MREHTDKTADERFEPPTPTGQVSDKDNPSETNTQLVSYGYTLDGEYHPQESATFTIPEHGVLAWRSYAGQVVQPTGTRMHGMTWQYDLDVLAADHTTYGRITLTVTYLTHDTHRAGLTGIKLDGHPIDGFTPDRLEYTVPVDNPDRYVLTPVFDKMTGSLQPVTPHPPIGRMVTRPLPAQPLQLVSRLSVRAALTHTTCVSAHASAPAAGTTPPIGQQTIRTRRIDPHHMRIRTRLIRENPIAPAELGRQREIRARPQLHSYAQVFADEGHIGAAVPGQRVARQ